MGASVEVEHNRRGTRGQLAGGTVEVQVHEIIRDQKNENPRLSEIKSPPEVEHPRWRRHLMTDRARGVIECRGLVSGK